MPGRSFAQTGRTCETHNTPLTSLHANEVEHQHGEASPPLGYPPGAEERQARGVEVGRRWGLLGCHRSRCEGGGLQGQQSAGWPPATAQPRDPEPLHALQMGMDPRGGLCSALQAHGRSNGRIPACRASAGDGAPPLPGPETLNPKTCSLLYPHPSLPSAPCHPKNSNGPGTLTPWNLGPCAHRTLAPGNAAPVPAAPSQVPASR